MSNIKRKVAGVAIASAVIFGTAGIAQADTSGTGGESAPTTTVAPKSKAMREYKAAMKTYTAAKKAIQATYTKAVKDATAAKKAALKAVKTKKGTLKIGKAFNAAVKAARDARDAALAALGAAPTAPSGS